MMTFFKDLRRRSKASFLGNASSSDPPLQSKSDISVPPVPSTATAAAISTTDSSSHSSNNTPPPSVKRSQSSAHLPYSSKSDGWLPQRPVPIGSQSNRNSIAGLSNASVKEFPTTSPYSPRVISISDNSWVHQKVLLIYGQAGDSYHSSLDGTVSIAYTQDAFPSTTWPVRDTHFKALVHLVPGPNKLRIDFTSPKVPRATAHTLWISINYLPLANFPPLELAILLGKDSDGQFDTPPNKLINEANTLDVAIRKFRMAAYLWQAFTGEQMYRNNFGRRCFRFEEEWQTSSISSREAESGHMRNEAKVHVIRSDKTVSELRALDTTKQDDTTSGKNELYRVASDELKEHFGLQPGQQKHVALLLLDSHWDSNTGIISGHTALGSNEEDLKLAMFGSHGLHSYPSSIEGVVAAFSDCARIDTNFVANYNNECGSNWETASSTIGRHLHEVGRLFGCPDRDNGIMGHDYLRFNRTFLTWEPYCTRTKEQGLRLCLQQDECCWHRLDALRFRFHPCFRLPSDAPLATDDSIQVWPINNGKVLVTSGAGIGFIEIFVDNQRISKSFLEYVNAGAGNGNVPKQISFTENEIRSQLPEELKKSKRIKLALYSGSLRSFTVDDICQLKAKHSTIKLPNGKIGYKGYKPSTFPPTGNHPEDLILECAFIKTKLLTSIRVYLGTYVNGIEFCYEDSTTQVFGSRIGEHGNDFVFDTRRGEVLLGFYVQSGYQLEGIAVLTSLGRKSNVFGNAIGGSSYTLIPPRGYKITGVSGSVGTCIDGISLIIAQ